jgi:hypothetical protein
VSAAPAAERPIYAAALDTYWDAGWRGILPLPPRSKRIRITGLTGNSGRTPSYADCYDWAQTQPDANLALRLPENVIGIDVDAYTGKTGAAELAEAEQKWGPLPATWRTTSRDDGTSGIRLYTIPTGLAWPTGVGPSIVIIRYAHRYAVAWPSTHPDTGTTYRWINPAGATTLGDVPTPTSLPALPHAWVQGLTGGRTHTPHTHADLTPTEATRWLAGRPTGVPCRAVQHVLHERTQQLTQAGTTRHDSMLEATQRLAHLAAEGHTGIPAALAALHHLFTQAVTADGSRTSDDAQQEWDRALAGAIRNAATTPTSDTDPCTDPFAGLIDKTPPSPSQLIRESQETTSWTTSTNSTAPPSSSTSAPATTTGSSPHPGAPTNTSSIGSSEATSTDPSESPSSDTPAPSWQPIDLTPYLDGTWTPDRPELFTRTDGINLIYPGKVHDFHGESESGKSLIVQALAAVELNAGQQVAYIDYEDAPGPITNRLLQLGATPTQIRDQFTYIRPETSPYAITELDQWRELLGRQLRLVIIDGVTDALGQSGAASKDNDEVSTWHRMIPRMLSTSTGAAVILIDHVIKNTETRGRFAIGGQAKMATLDGASFSVEPVEVIGKGLKGSISLRVGKDRPGEVRAHCGAYRSSDRSQEAARIIIDSTGDDNRISFQFDPPDTNVTDRHDDDGKPFKPTGVMEKVSRLLEAERQPMSFRQVETAYRDDGGRAKRQTFADAVNLLSDGGYITEEPGPRNARLFRSATVYRQKSDPEADAYEPPLNDLIAPTTPPSPNRPPTVPRDGEVTVPHHRPPVGAVGTVTDAPNTHRPPGHLDYQTGLRVDPHTGELLDPEEADS